MSKKEEKFKKRHNLILSTAEQLIKDKGYYVFKMSDISNHIDIAKGTLYLHFQSKEDLVFNLIHPKMVEFSSYIKLIVRKEESAISKVKEIIRSALNSSFFQFVLLSFPDMGALFQERNGHYLEEVQNEIIENFKQVINEGREDQIFNDYVPSEYSAHQLFLILDPLVYSLLVKTNKMSHEEFICYTIHNCLSAMEK